jgi:glycosyltransferase involved in cell wall biosynthesis
MPKTVTDVVSAHRWGRRLAGSFDLVVAHQVTVAAGFVATLRQVPLVMVYHASAVREARLRAASRDSRTRGLADHLLATVLKRLERTATKRARRIIVLSEYSRSLVVGDHPSVRDRVVVTPGGVDSQHFSPGPGQRQARARLGIPADEPLVLAIRRLEPRLGVETLLHAFQRVTSREHTRLVLVGDGSLAARLRSLASELRVGDRVSFVGAPSETVLGEWYRAADLFVLPPAPHEGFGMATLEALASGTPTVAAPVGASPELIAPFEPRLLARSAGADDLAAAISRALDFTGPDLRGRARQYASTQFDWDLVIGDWERVLMRAAELAD